MPGVGYFGFPEMGSWGLGGLGISTNWTFGPYSMTDKYRHSHNSHFGYTPSRRATLEIDVADDNYEHVKDKLYASGAVSVT